MTYILAAIVAFQFLALCLVSSRVKKAEGDIQVACLALDNIHTNRVGDLTNQVAQQAQVIASLKRWHMSKTSRRDFGDKLDTSNDNGGDA